MSFTQAPARVATAATEARRRALSDNFVEGLAVFILSGATMYILIGDVPFSRSVIDHSTEVSPVNRYIWLSLLSLSVPILWLRRRQVFSLMLASWPMLVLYAWFALSTTWALDPAASLRRVLLYDVLLLIVFAVTAGLPRPHLAHLVMALGAGYVIMVDLLSWPIVPGIAMTDLGFAGMHAQKNVTGEIALFSALTTATCLLRRPARPLAIVLWVLLAAAVLVLIATRSTTSQALGIASLVLLPVLARLLRGSRAVLVAVFISGAVAAGVILFGYVAWAGIAGFDPVAPLAQITFTERTDLWKFLLDNIAQRPFLGAGFGSFWAIDPAIQPSIQAGVWFGQGTEIANQGHDAYLDLAATTGLIGLALALFVFGRAIVLAAIATAEGGSIFRLGFLLILAVHGVTESGLFTANSVFGSFFVLTAIQLEARRTSRASQLVGQWAVPGRSTDRLSADDARVIQRTGSPPAASRPAHHGG